MAREDYPLYVHWYQTLCWLLETCDRFPKQSRWVLGNRVANHGLDAMEAIVEAIYTKARLPLLRQINRHIELLRVLLRIAHHRHYLSSKQFAYISEQLDTAGRMTGAWARSCGTPIPDETIA